MPDPELPTSAPQAVLAAGIVAATGVRHAELADAELLGLVQGALTLSTVWERAGASRPATLPIADSFGLTWWRDPGTLASDDVIRLQVAWDAAIGPADTGVSQYLRLQVDSIDEAQRLQALGDAGGRRIVAVVRSHSNDFRWRWPLRVGIVPGSQAEAWRTALAGLWLHPDLYRVALIDPQHDPQHDPQDDEQRYEIVVADAGNLPAEFPLKATLHFAGAVVAVGATQPGATLARLLDEYQPNTAIAMPSPDVTWWEAFIHELTHDCPIDAAAVAADARAIVAGDQWVLDVTAVGHWAIAADEQAGRLDVSSDIEQLQFRHEHQGASEIGRRARRADAAGWPPEVRRDNTPRAAAAAPDGPDETGAGAEPPPPSPPPPPIAPAPGPGPGAAPDGAPSAAAAGERRLIGACWFGEEQRRKVLPPNATGLLELKIAIPAEDEVAADVAFPTPSAPGPTAVLDVGVRCNRWDGEQHQQISLPLARPDQPSSSAAFEFTTGESGSVAEFEIVVSYLNRPLQTATMSAAVRSIGLPWERITLRTHPLSTPADPDPHSPPVDVALDGRGAELRNAVTGAAIPLTAIDELLDSIELVASQTLGRDDDPDDLDDRRAVDLLIELARMGSELRTQLTGLGLDAAAAVDILVMPTTRVFPLELVYEGPAPAHDAERCAHHRTSAPPSASTCTHVSASRVCPYAFWGMHRRISRTVQLAKRAPLATDRRLVVGDVLWGTAKQADHAAPPGREPTRLIGDAAHELLGATQREPVTSWREWRKQVTERHPGLLMLLAHTELSDREPALLIGTKSFLARPDVSPKIVRSADAPAPIVVLMACASASGGDAFGSLPGTFTAHGAGAVVATLTKIAGRHGAIAGEEIMRALAPGGDAGTTIGDALLTARRALVGRGVLLGLLLVGHGNTEIEVAH
jgi:hypothetical protein